MSAYVAVILFLAILDLLTSADTIWFQLPVFGWCIAVAIHAALVFVFPGRVTMTEQLIEKEMGKSRSPQ